MTDARIWDIPVVQLCNKHLIAQHREIHCIHNAILGKKQGFENYPEVIRWKGCIPGLCSRHFNTVMEMERRRINHKTPMFLGGGSAVIIYPNPWLPIPKQIELLKSKDCGCFKEGDM